MSTPDCARKRKHEVHPTVFVCYELLDVCVRGGVHDFTEGKYLVHEEDGTRDYHLTSQYWDWRRWQSMALNPLVWVSLLRKFARYPRPTIEMLRCLMWDQSWNWQFRDPAPTRLLRQTWEGV